jgi:hypothetical protein
MSSPHAPQRMPSSAHSHSRAVGSLKIAAAFAGGVACTAAAMAAWSGALDSILPATEPAQSRVVATSMSKTAEAAQKVTGNVASSLGNGHRTTKSNGTDTAKSAPANESRCRDRAWPYLDQRCLTQARPESAPSSQDVRIVTTDNVAPPLNSAGAASKPASSRRTTDAPPPSPSAPPAPAVAAANQPERAQGTSTATTAAPSQPRTDRQTLGVAPAQQESRDSGPGGMPRPDPQAYSRDRVDAADTRRRQRKEAREQLRRERREARQEGRERSAGADAGQRHETDRRPPRHENGRENDDDERDVTLTQTYHMRDGRRLTVTRTYRSAADRERYEAPERFGRRPHVRYHPAAPQAYIVAD